MTLKQTGLALALATGLVLGMVSCTSQAKKDAAAKVAIEATLPAGITVDVKDGVALL